jgi:hypothetical protein
MTRASAIASWRPDSVSVVAACPDIGVHGSRGRARGGEAVAFLREVDHHQCRRTRTVDLAREAPAVLSATDVSPC